MPRKKKEVIEEPVKEAVIVKYEKKEPDFGSGMAKVNNMLAAGYSIEDIRRS